MNIFIYPAYTEYRTIDLLQTSRDKKFRYNV